jgi:type II secretory ATPase GspE/PulE/Tfp pilus assembly ATPase PilB-like protein
MRVDGVLNFFLRPEEYYAAIVSRIKIMSELDIAKEDCLKTVNAESKYQITK